jgi:hypothetical protein
MALIKPDVYAQLVREKFDSKMKIGSMAVDFGVLTNTTKGEKIIFPKWKLISDAKDLVKGQPIPTEGLDQDESFAMIKQVAAPGIVIYDIDDVAMLGNAINEASIQHGLVIARKFDQDLIDEALTSPLKSASASATAITNSEIDTAIGLYGDEQDTETFAGIVINSRLSHSFYSMPEFVDTTKTFNTNGNGIVRNGVIGYYRGIPVFMADHGTYDSTKSECLTFIIKKNALGYKTKRKINTEEKREADYKRSTIFSDMIYAVKLLADDGIVIVRKTIA